MPRACASSARTAVCFLVMALLAGGSSAARAEDGEWPMAGKDHASTRFSGLDQITRANVKQLRIAWTFSTGVLRGHEAAPIVVGGTMYVTTPYPNDLYALDLTRPGANVKWRYEPKPAAAAQGVACCDVVNRGAAFADGKVIFNTLDAHTVAVDAATGSEVWRTRLGDINRGETMTMAPLVVKDEVLVGNSGGELGVRGWLAALEVATGRELWRAYSTGPDPEVLIGEEFRPFYPQDRGKDLGATSWPPDAWRIGGGTVWGWISYDPELDLIYYGTGNPGPWNLARDPDTGRARWALQWSPHDMHDYDGINELVLVDLEIGGAPRKVLLRPERNGYVYVVDRASGEILSATPFVHVTSSTGIDLGTGRPTGVEAKKVEMGRIVRDICPAPPGAKDWNPSAWSPRTRLLYLPTNNLCYDAEGIEANYIAGTPYLGVNARMYAGPGGNRGAFIAWDPVQARAVWTVKENFPVWSGALATAGDLVFYGTMEGWFKALDAHSGEVLWQERLGSGIVGQPVSYRAPDGKQYVAVLSGVGGWSGAIVAGDLDPRDGSAALGFVNAMTDLSQHTTKGGMLYVFSLP